MRAAIGYDRQSTKGDAMLNIILTTAGFDKRGDLDGFVETNEEIPPAYTRYEEMRGTLRAKFNGDYRPYIRIVSDQFNNVGRLCTYRNSGGRVWQVKNSMSDQNGVRYFLIQHLITGAREIVWVNAVGNLY